MQARSTQSLMGAPPSSPKLRAKNKEPLEEATEYKPVAAFWIHCDFVNTCTEIICDFNILL